MSEKIKNQFNASTFKNTVFQYGDKSIKKCLGTTPVFSEIFIGRNCDLENIHNKLFSGESLLLLVNGVGGIGKTTVASHYYRKYFYEYKHLAWVYAETGIADALLSLANDLGMSFEEHLTEEQRVEILISELVNLEKPGLLVIDNANDREDFGKWYTLLRSFPKLHLLVTTRINEYESAALYPILKLNEEDSKELFKKHYKDHDPSEDRLLEDIFIAIDYNTLVIELLAKNLKNFNDGLGKDYSLTDLLNDIQEKGLLGLSQSDDVTTDYKKFKTAKPEAIIEVMYDLAQLQETEKMLLSVLSVLPAEKILYEDLKTLLPSVENLRKVLLSLFQKGWIEFDADEKSFKCHPVVQEIIRKQNKDNLSGHCEELVSRLVDKLDYEPSTGGLVNVSYEKGVVFVLYGEIICHYLYPLRGDISILSERLGNFYISHGNLRKALKYFEDCSTLEKELYESNQENVAFKNGLAISYEKLGQTHTYLGDLAKALKYFEDETSLFEELYESNPENVAFKNGLAISYSKLGQTHTYLGDLAKALKYFEDYSTLEKELYESNPDNVGFKNGLAISYEKLGQTHTYLGDLAKALKYFEDYSTLKKELYESNPENVGFKNGLAISYLKLGDTHTSLGDLAKALKYFEDYSTLEKELYESNQENVDFKNGLAISYSRLGQTHTSLGDLAKALKYFEDYSTLEKELYESNPENVAFKNGLAISYSKLGETHTSRGDLAKALKYFEDDALLTKELYESNPDNVGFKNGLAISYAKLGVFYRDNRTDKNQARSYFEKAKLLWKELSRDFPDYVEFTKNWEQINKELDNL